jgi:hypothetical protein
LRFLQKPNILRYKTILAIFLLYWAGITGTDYEVTWTDSACNLQESVVTTVVKLCLKSLQEYVRLQTFNRSGFQQIQLDVQFLRASLKEIVEDEAAVDFLLDEVNQGIT